MSEQSFPVQSTATLVKASLIAISLALVVYFTIILPAEYSYDPTGAGEVLGLLVLSSGSDVESGSDLNSQSKDSLTSQESGPTKDKVKLSKDEATINVPSHSGVEYKFRMPQYGSLKYQWSTNGEELYFDFHGEPKGDTSGYFESYTIATTNQVEGTMTVPFDGVHGWYWKNTSESDIVVTLKTEGSYEVVGIIH